MPGDRGGKRDYKPRRGGGRTLCPYPQALTRRQIVLAELAAARCRYLDHGDPMRRLLTIPDGNEVNTPDRWEPRKRNQDVEESGSGSGSDSGSESDSSEDGLDNIGAPKPKKEKDTSANPNRAAQKSIKASELSSMNVEPSRKEREAAEKKAAQERYWKLHQAGKTDQAKADLARLAVIKEKREAAAKAREAEKASAVEEARIALEKTKGIGKKV